MFSYFIIYKPYKMLSQFVRMPKKKCLADLDFTFPEGINALGRLDENSEGLLILSNDKQLNRLLLKPENEHKRVYWVQVQGIPANEELKQLGSGIHIRLDNLDYVTKPCGVKIIAEPADLPARGHPVKPQHTTTWIELTLMEGKFHQVRKMTAATGHQTMRLIRVAIENVLLNNMKPGEVRELKQEEIYSLLKIKQR
ncbi:MAG TPA: pseudouridine synthase [Bacteroidia bacterium]|jgi:23S rRNA pseudouridine2457 synthase|nr:pseudouridine synthase [Bacteroidia bacterium]